MCFRGVTCHTCNYMPTSHALSDTDTDDLITRMESGESAQADLYEKVAEAQARADAAHQVCHPASQPKCVRA